MLTASSRSRIGRDSRVLEIGCGTGQATRDLARTGAAIECLEPGPALAALARRNLAGIENVEVAIHTFESVDATPASFDAIVSATAFHWIDPNVSFAKSATLLRPGGTLALLTNAHAAGGTQEQLSAAISELHREMAPEIATWTFPSVDGVRERAEAGGDIAGVWSRVERKLGEAPDVSHRFEPPTVTTYPWLARYTRRTYLQMLASQSSYALTAPSERDRLLGAIGRLVDEALGGTVTKQYVAVLATATKRRGPGRSARG